MKQDIEQVSLPYLSRPAAVSVTDSGHTICIIPKPGEVVHLHTAVRTGSIHEDDATTGISHFLEHLMFKGTASHPAGEFDRILEGMGARINAATSKDWTQYFVTIPAGENGRFYRQALELHADMMLHPLLPEEEIGPPFDPANPQVEQKRERHVVIEEIKMGKDNPVRRCFETLNALMYRQHPYHREVIGTAEVIAAVTRETLLGYYRRWYTADNMVTVVAGDLDPASTIAGIREQFRFGAERTGPLPAFSPEPEQAETRAKHLTADVQTGYVWAGFRGPAGWALREVIALDVAMLALGEGRSSRLHQRLVEQLPDTPFFDVGSAQWEYRDETTLMAHGVCRPDVVAESAGLLRAQVAGLVPEPVAGAELEKALTRLEARFASDAERAADLCFRVADSMVRRGDLSLYTEYLPTLRALTPADVAAAVQRYLGEERLCLVTMAPGENE
ncbi:MAG: insulinase family protein [Armatimonadetes bacterium]|nr:insulinase family protein [Armatimonadota bacterium]